MTRLLGSFIGLVSIASVYVQATLDSNDIDFILHADRATNDSLLWGTYRPNLYFGTRTRFPESLMTGLIWFDGGEFQGFQRKKICYARETYKIDASLISQGLVMLVIKEMD